MGKQEFKIAILTEIDFHDAFNQCRELINLFSGLVTMLERQVVSLTVAFPAIIKVIPRFEEIASRGGYQQGRMLKRNQELNAIQ
jgi:hypothetical protein